MFLLFNPTETPGPVLLLAAVAAVGGLVGLARLVPATVSELRLGRASSSTGLSPLALGIAFVVGFFLLAWVGPQLLPVPAAVAAALVAWCVAFGAYVARRRESFAAPRAQLDLVLGSLSFLLLLAFTFGVLGDFGAIPVGVAVLLIGWRLRTRLGASGGPSAPRGAVGGGLPS
jgi:hypothetical protein